VKENDGIPIYIPKETVLKEIAAKIDLAGEISDSNSYTFLSEYESEVWCRKWGGCWN
jgi:hypothetical protein